MKGYVYFIVEEDTGRVKIGKTLHKPETRLKEFSTGNSHPLKLLAFIETESPTKIEKELHEKFDKFRIKGEWFYPDPSLVAYSICKTMGTWYSPLPESWANALYKDFKRFFEEQHASPIS